MTDRIRSFTVILDKDLRDDVAEKIRDTMLMIKHVISVQPNITNAQSVMAEARARADLGDKLIKVIWPEGI